MLADALTQHGSDGLTALPGDAETGLAQVAAPQVRVLVAGGKVAGMTGVIIAAGCSSDYEITNRKRCAGRIVVLMIIRHFGVPEQRPGVAVQGDDVRVVRHPESAIASHGRRSGTAAGNDTRRRAARRSDNRAGGDGAANAPFPGARHHRADRTGDRR